MSSNPKNIARKPVQEIQIGERTCNIILMTMHEAYLVALSATVTSTYIPVMTPGLLDTFPGAS